MDHTVALAKGSARRTAILYRDAKGVASSRVIVPQTAIGDFVDDRLQVHSIAAYCEQAKARRNFRLDRILVLNDVESGAEIEVSRWVMGLEMQGRPVPKRAAHVALPPPLMASPDAPVFDEEAFLAELVRDNKSSPAAIAEIRKAFARNKLAEARKEVRRTQKALEEAVQRQGRTMPDEVPLPAGPMAQNVETSRAVTELHPIVNHKGVIYWLGRMVARVWPRQPIVLMGESMPEQ